VSKNRPPDAGVLQFSDDAPLFDRVAAILDDARSRVVRSVNHAMVSAYWLIGREIVEEEQNGKKRAVYGKSLIDDLSRRLTKRYGRGYSTTNLRYFRQFYLVFMDRTPAIRHPTGGELRSVEKRHLEGGASPRPLSLDLSWSHYRALMRLDSEGARAFYEEEAIRGQWSKAQLERQMNTMLFERLLKSSDKDGLLQLANEGQVAGTAAGVIKDPYVLEFLDLPESHRLVESDLEAALTTHMQEFLLELGAGFAFIARQKRLTLDGDHFYADLVFYHVRLKCYVIIDLKAEKLTHGDLGQMQMYVHYFDREICTNGDSPTLGLILCTDKNDAMVEYVLDEGKERIFASRYKLELPPKEKLRSLLLEWREEVEDESRGTP
jgi:predicted nuclease of restriction endonuclease-like (RecB) superfamily